MIVDFLPTEEQTLIDATIRSLLDDKLSVSRLREVASHHSAAERGAWEDLAAIGLFGLGLAESEGGIGYSLIEEVLMAINLGRNLVSPCILAQMIAVHLAEDDEIRDALMDGSARAAFLNVFNNKSAHLLDGEGATHFVVVNDGVVLRSRDQFPSGVAIEGLDETVAMTRINMAYAPIERRLIADRLSLLVGAYLSGMAQAATEMAVEYAKIREQFGHVIGAFQALKHQCADMHVRAEAAYSQCLYTATLFGVSESGDTVVNIACARLLARDAALANAKNNIQIHGGMGFTAECAAHFYLKRAHTMSMLGSNIHAERMRAVQPILGVGQANYN